MLKNTSNCSPDTYTDAYTRHHSKSIHQHVLQLAVRYSHIPYIHYLAARQEENDSKKSRILIQAGLRNGEYRNAHVYAHELHHLRDFRPIPCSGRLTVILMSDRRLCHTFHVQTIILTRILRLLNVRPSGQGTELVGIQPDLSWKYNTHSHPCM